MLHPAFFVFMFLMFCFIILMLIGVIGEKSKCLTAAIWLIPAITYFLVVSCTKLWLASIGFWLIGWFAVAAVAYTIMKIEKKYKKSRAKTA